MNLVKQYIDTNNKLPSTHNENKNITRLGWWVLKQKTSYKKKENIMKKQDIYNKWTEVITSQKYKQYFD